MNTKKDKEYWHEKGTLDRALNKGFHKPHGFFSALTTWTAEGMQKMHVENRAYYLGWTYWDDRDLAIGKPHSSPDDNS
jgi:hypothetical protein